MLGIVGSANPKTKMITTYPILENRLALTLSEAAQATGYSTRTLRRFNERGLLKFSRAARTISIRKDELTRFLRDSEDSAWGL